MKQSIAATVLFGPVFLCFCIGFFLAKVGQIRINVLVLHFIFSHVSNVKKLIGLHSLNIIAKSTTISVKTHKKACFQNPLIIYEVIK